jgi:hypothetical protein
VHAPVLGDRSEGSNHCKEDSRLRSEKVKEEGEEEDEAEKVLIQHGITKHNAAIDRCHKNGSA